METRDLVCIRCPLGCMLSVEMNGCEVTNVTGNTCKRGAEYANKELTNPTRIVTSSVSVLGSNVVTVSVKTKDDIPKGKIFDCMKALQGVSVQAPVRIGDIIVKNIAETGVDIIATKNAM